MLFFFLCCFFLVGFQTEQQEVTNSYAAKYELLDSTLTGTAKDTIIINKYLEQSDSLENQGDFKDALEVNLQALSLCKASFGEYDSLTAAVYGIVADNYISIRNLDLGLEMTNRQLEIGIKLFGENNILQGMSLTQLGDIQRLKGNLNLSIDYFKKAHQIFLKVLGEQHHKTMVAKFFIGFSLKAKGKFKEALKYFVDFAERSIQINGPDHINIAKAYTNIGNVYKNIGDYDKALEYYYESLRIKELNLGVDHPLLRSSLQGIGIVCDLKGDYEKAIIFYEKAISIVINRNGDKARDLAGLYNNIAISLKNKNNNLEAEKYYNKALEIEEGQKEKNEILMAFLYYNLAVLENDKGNYNSAIQYYRKALKIRKSKLRNDHPNIADVYGNMGVTFKSKGDYQQAINYYNKALGIWSIKANENRERIARTYSNLGNTWMAKGDLIKGRENIQKSLNTLKFELDQLNDFSNVLDLQQLQHSLSVLLDYYNLQKNEKPTLYSDSLSFSYQIRLALEDYIQKEYNGQSTRKFYSSESIPIYEEAIENILQRNRIEEINKAFELSEKTKSRFLTEKMQSAASTSSFGLPIELIEKEHQLNIDLAYFEKKKYTATVGSELKKDSIVSMYENKLFDLKRQKDSLVNVFKTDYPTYHNLRYSQKVITVKEVQQKLLSDQQMLLEYFVGDSTIFIFTIAKNDYQIHQVKKDFPLKKWVQELRSGIYQPFNGQYHDQATIDQLKVQYQKRAFQLYQKLVQPIEDQIADSEQLIIIPDEVLGYLPFDALLSSPVDSSVSPRDYPYLLRNYQISTAYSASSLNKMRQIKHRSKPSKNFLAVAPSFPANDSLILAARFIDGSQNRNRLGPLNFNIPEAKSLQAIMGGEVLLDNQATEKAFTDIASDFSILHLSTHGKANDKAGDYSFLAFTEQKDSIENEWLYNRELYELQLNADMVVLSACETGIGELQRGEGIISLARGFSYAGAKSIITSLWSVNDKQTPELMKHFYTNLKAGQSKDAALRQAKLTYLESSTNPEPYFWAAFIPIGDMTPIELSAGFPVWGWWGIAFGILLLFIWQIKNKR